MNDLHYGAEGAEEAAAILCQLDTNSIEDLPSAISRLLMSKKSHDWIEDDILECVVRVLQTIQYRPPSASRYWCIREIDERTCYIELLNQKPDEKVAVYSTLSRDDPAVELAEFKLSIPGLSASDSFHRVLRHSAGNLSVDCTEYCSGSYHVIPAKIGFKVTDVSRICLKVQLPTLAELSVAIQDIKGYKEFTRNDSLYANSSTRITIPPMAGKIPAILDHVRRVCDGYRGIVEIVRKQINREKQERIQRIVRGRLQGSKRIFNGVDSDNGERTANEKRMDAMEKRVKSLEINNAVLSSKLQFETVLAEMKRRDFENVLVLIAQAQREAKAARLGFGNVLHEMKKRNFALLLDGITKSRREAKAALFAERLQQLQMEAQEAGIALPTPIFMPNVVALTGIVTQYSDDIPLATPVPKQL